VRVFWPICESAQADYETLRAAALGGRIPAGAAWLRFSRHGLAGLIDARMSQRIFAATLTGALRPAWSPPADPRHEALAAVHGALVAVSETMTEEIAR
jgi:hypothetical protein